MTAFVRVANQDRALADPVRVALCNSFGTRLRGLMGRRSLPRHEGVLLAGDRDSRADAGIHMLFVPFDLAVFWINSDLRVVDKVIARSWRLAYIPAAAARYVLELHPDHSGDYEIGNRVEIRDA